MKGRKERGYRWADRNRVKREEKYKRGKIQKEEERKERKECGRKE